MHADDLALFSRRGRSSSGKALMHVDTKALSHGDLAGALAKMHDQLD